MPMTPCHCIECGEAHCDETAACAYACSNRHEKPEDDTFETFESDEAYDSWKDRQ